MIVYFNMCNINCCRNAYKLMCCLIFLLSSLVIPKGLQYSIDITAEQSLSYVKLADAIIWISKYALFCANCVTYSYT